MYHNQVLFVSNVQSLFNIWKSVSIIHKFQQGKQEKKLCNYMDKCKKNNLQNLVPFTIKLRK